MKETYQEDIKEGEEKEAEAKSGYETLMTSKTAEIEAAGKAIETKTARSGEVAVETVQAKADFKSTTKAVAEDTDFKANLEKNCATKQKEWDERCKLRAEEITAISETIDLLNSDDALELFKKAVPSAAASFIQTSATTGTRVRRASELIRKAMSSDKAHSSKRHMILAALHTGMGGFEKVTGMIDGMVGVLEGEQVKDDDLDKWCLAELDKAKEEAKATETDIGDLGNAVEQQRDAIATVTSEIEALKAGLVELDKSVT